jgi:predicted nucleotidyltransferase
MNILFEPHKEILRKLIQFNVEFILIGGYAVNFHGYNRATADMDIWLSPDNQNKLKFLNFLKAEGFEQESLDHITNTDFTKHAAFHIGEKPLQVDFLTIISGLDFSEAESKKQWLAFGDTNVPVLHLDHLILSKISSGRTKDKLDVEELQKIMRLKKKK